MSSTASSNKGLLAWSDCLANPPRQKRRAGAWIPVEAEAEVLDLAARRFLDWQQGGRAAEARESDEKIPRVIHQIWFGNENRLGEKERGFIYSWKKHNPDFEFRWWTETALKEAFLCWGLDYKPIANSPNAGEKSDIARYAVLYHLGGIYIDVDFECIRPIPQSLLDGTHQVVAGLANVPCMFEVANSWIAAMPGSTIVQTLYNSAVSPETNASRLIESYSGNMTTGGGTIQRTGPGLLSKIWLRHMHESWLLLPSSYMYPVPNDLSLEQPIGARCETFAVHWWHKSWQT